MFDFFGGPFDYNGDGVSDGLDADIEYVGFRASMGKDLFSADDEPDDFDDLNDWDGEDN